ncbi:MAG: discoidin domain-containing protein [bacterium]
MFAVEVLGNITILETISKGNTMLFKPFMQVAVRILYGRTLLLAAFLVSITGAFAAEPTGKTGVIPAEQSKIVTIKVQVDSESAGSEGMKALDGDPATMWHSQWQGSSPAHPHEITLDLGQPYALTGFRYSTKSGGCNGTIRDYEFYIGADLKTLSKPVAKGTFANNSTWSWTIALPQAVTGRFVRLRALSEAKGGPWTSIAELELLSDGVVFRAASSTVVGPPTELSVAGAASDPQLAELEAQYRTLMQDLRSKISANQALRVDASILKTDRDPLDIVLRRTAALLAHVQQLPGAPDLAGLGRDLQKIRATAEATGLDLAEERGKLYVDACRLRRQIAFSNPLLNFDSILFITRNRPHAHIVVQYEPAHTLRSGGNLSVLSKPFSDKPVVRDLLANAVVEQGRLKGQRLEGGSFLSPSLSYDAKQIAFAFVEHKGSSAPVIHLDPARGHWTEGQCYHIFTMNTDGSGLKQITDGTWSDFDPCWMPSGRMVFISERRGGYLRCGGSHPTYTLYDMMTDGSDMRPLSVHETNEWHPSVMKDGRILYTRWDYVDRHGCVAHHPWTITPDGRDARAVHGNYSPRGQRADAEMHCREIPNSSKFVATAAPHHEVSLGSLVLVDPQVKDDDGMGPVRRITPEAGFPESAGGGSICGDVYGTPWPLSEDYYLCIYDREYCHPIGNVSRAQYPVFAGVLESFARL